MGNETLYATKGYLDIIRWIDPSINIDSYIVQRVENGGTAKPGDLMTGAGETQGLVDVLDEADTGFLGIMRNETIITADYDIDEVASTGVTIDILRPTGGRTICAVVCGSLAGPVAWEEGDYARADVVDGQVEAWIYNDTNMSTDTLALVVGKLAEVYAGNATSYKVVHIWY